MHPRKEYKHYLLKHLQNQTKTEQNKSKEIKRWVDGERRSWKGDKKGIKMSYAHVPTSHEECKLYVPHTYTNKIKLKKPPNL